MLKSQDLPDCYYEEQQPSLIKPNSPTPNHKLCLSNLDDQKFLRFSIKYLYLFQKSVPIDSLKLSLSRVLVDYYPLAGRLRTSCSSQLQDEYCNRDDHEKLEVDCNGEGAVFAEAFMDITAEDFLQVSHKPNRSWRKLLYRVEAHTFLDIPPLVVQVTNLRCGGMIMCTAINHCLCDGIGTSQFLHAWAYLLTTSTTTTTYPTPNLPIIPFHYRHVFKSGSLPSDLPLHPAFTKDPPSKSIKDCPSLNHYLQSQPLIPASITFKASHILSLKRQCVPSLKCTTFEVLASHTWRSWVKSLDLPHSLNVKLLFSMNIRKKMDLEIPEGYYGNGFVLACVQATVSDLVNFNLHHGVKLVQQAKSSLNDDYIKGIVESLEDKTVKTDLTASLVISQWSKLGLEDLDFGEGKPLHMGPLTSDIYCLFLPVVGDLDAVNVLVSMPERVVGKFKNYMNNVEANGRYEREEEKRFI